MITYRGHLYSPLVQVQLYLLYISKVVGHSLLEWHTKNTYFQINFKNWKVAEKEYIYQIWIIKPLGSFDIYTWSEKVVSTEANWFGKFIVTITMCLGLDQCVQLSHLRLCKRTSGQKYTLTKPTLHYKHTKSF